MAKTKSSFINMLLTLLIVTFVAAAALGFVYELTKEPIKLAKQKKVEEAIKQVIPVDSALLDKMKIERTAIYLEKKSDAIIDVKNINNYKKKNIDSLIFFAVNVNGKLQGTAIKTYTEKGFSGRVVLMVGFMPDTTINKVSVLEHKETPGLGSKMTGKFKTQFENLKINELPNTCLQVVKKKEPQKIDAITAATISSRAFCDAVQRAYNIFTKNK